MRSPLKVLFPDYREAAFAHAIECSNFALYVVGVFREKLLQRSFSYFPPRWPGVALLAMRLMVGSITLAEGFSLIASQSIQGQVMRVAAGVAVMGSGALLFLGFLTPVAAAAAMLAALVFSVVRLPVQAVWLFDSRMSALEACVICAALVVLGPGAYSVDASLFGRRQLLIPKAPPKNEP